MVRIGQSTLTVAPSQPLGLVGEAILVVVDPHRAERALGEVEDLVPLRRPLAGDQVGLVVAVEMDLVGAVADLLALEQLVGDVGIAGRGDQGREPVEAGEDAVLDLAGRHLARPADDRRHAEAAFQRRALAAGERRLAAVGPGEVLGAVVGREHDDGVLIEAVVLQVLHDRADDVVELRHAGLLDAPAVLGRAHRLVLVGEVGDDVHAGRVEPEEERLAVALGLVDELERVGQDLVVDRLHPLRIERAGVLDLLLADLAPARLDGRVVLVGGPAVDHVARPDLVHQVLRVVAVRRILHRVEVVEVAEELVEAVHVGRNSLRSPRWFLPNWPVA